MNSRWTTLDRILEIDPEKGAKALRNVPNTLSIFDSHFPRFNVLPGVLIYAYAISNFRLFSLQTALDQFRLFPITYKIANENATFSSHFA